MTGMAPSGMSKAWDLSNKIGIHGGTDYVRALEIENKELKKEIQHLREQLKKVKK